MRKIIAAILIVSITVSCEKDLSVEFNEIKPMPTLYSLFMTDSTWAVDLSQSANVLDYYNNIQEVTNATVTILNEHGDLVESLPYYKSQNIYGNTIKNNYRGKTFPEAGKLYSIEAKIPGQPTVTASGRIPSSVPISSVEIDSSRYPSENAIELILKFDDPGQERNFYQIKIIRKVRVVNYSYQSTPIGTPIPPKPIIKDSTVTYTYETFPFNSLNLVTEIRGGTVFKDDTFNGKKNTIRFVVGNYSYPGKKSNSNPIRLVLMNVSEGYYNYFSSVKVAQETRDNPLAQPVQLFSNIENGLGLFSGYSVSEMVLK